MKLKFWGAVFMAPIFCFASSFCARKLSEFNGKDLDEALVPLLFLNLIMSIKYCTEVARECYPPPNDKKT